MGFLERLWEVINIFFGGILRTFERGITSVFGSSNARQLKKYYSRVDAINALEPKYKEMSDDELANQTVLFRQRLRDGETLEDILEEAFAVCREAGWRYLTMRHYDVQLIGGMVLHSGAIAEMITGEGKTLVATLPAYLNAIEGRGVHVVTVNDYLARRDMEWMAPLYMGLGLTVGAIQSEMRVLDRQEAYAKDITYGTNNEFGFDYLRDNMRSASRADDAFPKEQQQSQGFLNYAIVDEVDNILIDEARTPLIISGPAYDNVRKYGDADKIARQLRKGDHFSVSEKDHSVNLTDEGVRAAEKLAGVESFYTAGNMEWPHLIDNSLKAHYLYKRDVNYVVKEGSVIIVDEFTGRLMEGRQWSDGLHQAVEAKENVKIKEETQTLATITLQNFFKLYKKISGMTGTAMTEANEFWKIYKLDVVAIPPNRHLQRIEFPDVIYCTEREKYTAVAEEIERTVKWDVLVRKDEELWGTIVREDDETIEFQEQGSNKKEKFNKSDFTAIERRGRPVLVGTVSIEKSERLANLLDKRGIEHEVLNAKHHRREADIVAQAGRKNAVTIATNMAGRGTDIVLGGNPETLAWARLQDTYETRLDVPRDEWDTLVEEIDNEYKMSVEGEEVKELGGLHVVATERHEARRIDLQLRGRCGRQGDPGSSRFFLCLEDDLMRIFAGPWVKSILERLGMKDGERIESKMVTRRIEAAQKKVEERNFEIRKNLLEYDEVMDEQRKRVYSYRQQILDGVNCRDLLVEAIQAQIDLYIAEFLSPDYGIESFAEWASSQLSTQLDGKEFRGMDFKGAESFAIDEAQRNAERQIYDAIDENLPNDEEQQDWKWEALSKFASARWGINIRDRELKRIGDRDQIAEHLIQEAYAALEKVDLSEGSVLLEEDFPIKTALAWVRSKFGIELSIDEVEGLNAEALKEQILTASSELYDEKEAMYPIIVGFHHYAKGQSIDREGLVEWAAARFNAPITLDDVKSKQRDEVRDLLVDYSRKHLKEGSNKLDAVRSQVHSLFGATDGGANVNGALTTLSDWFRSELDYELDLDELRRLNRDQLENRLTSYVERRYRPEMRRLERTILLQIVDGAWKDHLLVMDHLRNSVGLVGWGQMDPKVEYKREGMKLFDQMWRSVEERVSDLVFRIEQMDDDVVNDTWVETSAQHDAAESTGDIVRQQEAAISNSQQQSEGKIDPIRNTAPRVGRNDPCPCNSGKKYKNCCLRNRTA